MKRILSIFLVLSLLVFIGCGCSDETVVTESTVITNNGEANNGNEETTDNSTQTGSDNQTSNKTQTSSKTEIISQSQSGGQSQSGNQSQTTNQSQATNSTQVNNNAQANNNTQANSGTQSSNKTQTNNSQTTTTQNSNFGTAPKYDLKGAKISIVAPSNATFKTSKGSTATDKALYESLQKVQKDLNCQVNVKIVPAEQIKTDLIKNQLSGIKYADIISMNIHNITALITSQAIMDLNSIKSIDLSKNYMNSNDLVKRTSIKGKNFLMVTPNTSFGQGKGVFYNKSILKELGYKDNYIYDLVDNGKWTIAEMRNMAKKAVLDKDGKAGLSTNDRFGMCVTDMACSGMEAVLAGCRVDMLTNNNGNIAYNMTSSSVINALEMAKSMYLEDGTAYGPQGFDNEIINMFKTGHGLFLVIVPSQADLISDMDNDYGFVPFPSVDGKDFNAWLNWNPHAISIPTGLSDSEAYNAGAFLQAFCYEQQSVVETRYNEYAVRFLRDEQSLKNLKTFDKSTIFATSSMLCSPNFHSLSEGTYRIIYSLGKEASTKGHIDPNKGPAIAALNDFLSKIK